MDDNFLRESGSRLLFHKLLVLLLFLMLAACRTAEENGSPDIPPTPPHVEPATATVEGQTQETAEPTRVEPTEPALEPTAAPTIPPELAATEPPLLPPVQPVSAIQLAPVVGGFERPTFLTHAEDGRLFVSEQVGRISVIENGQVLPPPFLDIQDQVGSEALEQGLLSFVFHPDYTQNGSFFVNYTDLNGDTVVSRFQVSAAGPNTADPLSEQIILTVDQPFGNHNGGQLQFGPDGYLYVGMGDGGSGGDPENHGQNPATLLGALLRIDVDGGSPYAVPADNPFANDSSEAGEVWAYGLRNPWRFSFDRLTGDLYLGDVGQRIWEEVNFQPAAGGGGENYGWNILEGNHCYETANCDSAGTVLPVAEYSHDSGCSVTGGYVYRGSQYPALTGNYFFADYCSGIVWGLFRQDDGGWLQTVVLESGRTVSSFGEDMNGELYLLDHASGEVLQVQSTN
jgi:glucose/arabinose dehydrogenase